MTRGSMKEFARACLRLAEEYIEDAKLSLVHSRLRTALNCAYYAMSTLQGPCLHLEG